MVLDRISKNLCFIHVSILPVSIDVFSASSSRTTMLSFKTKIFARFRPYLWLFVFVTGLSRDLGEFLGVELCLLDAEGDVTDY